jgi:F-type H+-transporting ATPase subunit b
MEKLGINLGFFLVQLLNFAILAIILKVWAYDPIVKMLNNRKTKIAQGLEDARVAAEARANAEKEAQKIIADAQAEANRRIAEATERAEKAAADIRAEAEAQRARSLEAAKEDALQERNRLLADLRTQVAALAIAAANKVIGEALDEQRQHALINEFFSGVKAGKVVVADGADLGATGGAAEVTSAVPLTPEEQESVKKDITGKMGATASVSFKVDPSILGGLVIRVGDKIIDGSVAGKLEGLRQAIR